MQAERTPQAPLPSSSTGPNISTTRRKKFLFLVAMLAFCEVLAWGVDYIFEFQPRIQLTLDQLLVHHAPIAPAPRETSLVPSRDSSNRLNVRPRDDGFISTITPADLARDRLRVFVAGGSAAYGFPHEYEESFAGLLESWNSDRIQVHNVAQVGATSGELIDSVRKIADAFEPDVLVIYSGNNEWFHWQPPAARELDQPPRPAPKVQWDQSSIRGLRVLCRSRLVAGLTWWPLKWSLQTQQQDPRRQTLLGDFHPHEELIGVRYSIAHPAPPEWLQTGEWLQQKEQYLNQFEHNLHEMVELAHNSGARVVLLTVPFRYRLSPAWKHPQPVSFDERHREQTAESIRTSWKQYQSGRYDAALATIDQALLLDPLPPVLHYLRGMSLEALQQPHAAALAYATCREQMIGNLGSRLSINNRIRRVAADSPAELLDLSQRFDDLQRAHGGYFNRLLIVDDCHPSLLGHQLIAKELEAIMWPERPHAANPD